MSTGQQNPLIPEILSLLRQRLETPAAERFGIHHLLTALSSHPAFDGLGEQNELALFKKNFLLMNGLYQLQQSLWEEHHVELVIEPLDLRLRVPGVEGVNCAGMIEGDPMRGYYLDWQHYDETTQEQVVALLEDFWRRVNSEDARDAAFSVLGLGPDADATAIQRRYRQLAKQHHPDNGGNAAQFIAVRQAYETLRV